MCARAGRHSYNTSLAVIGTPSDRIDASNTVELQTLRDNGRWRRDSATVTSTWKKYHRAPYRRARQKKLGEERDHKTSSPTSFILGKSIAQSPVEQHVSTKKARRFPSGNRRASFQKQLRTLLVMNLMFCSQFMRLLQNVHQFSRERSTEVHTQINVPQVHNHRRCYEHLLYGIAYIGENTEGSLPISNRKKRVATSTKRIGMNISTCTQ
jgi:hypothetical protein